MKQRFSKRTRLVSALLTLAMVFTFLPFSALVAEGGYYVPLNVKCFPDETFRKYLEQFDKDDDGYLGTDERNAVTKIAVGDMDITTLEGISYFPNLEALYCQLNDLTELDVSQNPALKTLSCWANFYLTSLDVSKNTELEELSCGQNQLSSLDVSQTAVTTLDAEDNKIDINVETTSRSFDLSTLPGKFDVTKATEWNGGTVRGNTLKVNAGVNQVTYTYDCGKGFSKPFTLNVEVVPDGSIAINASNFPDPVFREYLRNAYHYDSDVKFDQNGDGIFSEEERNAVTSIDLYNGYKGQKLTSLQGIDFFPNLELLSCSRNQLTELDVSKNTKLTWLGCIENQLTELDVSKNTALEELYCYENNLTSLDVSKNTALKMLNCRKTQLTELDVSKNTVLEELYCDYNQLTSLDVSKNTALDWLTCEQNNLTSLDVSQNTKLTVLYCGTNQLSSLDVSQNPALQWLYCQVNQLTSLDVSQNPALQKLQCDSNQLTSLDVSQTAVTELKASDNQIDIYVEETPRTFDLSTLPGFDVTKTSGWKDGTVNGSILTVDEGATKVTYSYDCGRGLTSVFSLQVLTLTRIKQVNLRVITPKKNEMPDETVVILDNGADVCDAKIRWGMGDIGGEPIPGSFRPGKRYTLQVGLYAKPGYKFSQDTVCTVNGQETKFLMTLNDDTEYYATRSYVVSLTPGGFEHDHKIEMTHDEHSHWMECPICHTVQDTEAHVYDDDKDTTCNVCGYVRSLTPGGGSTGGGTGTTTPPSGGDGTGTTTPPSGGDGTGTTTPPSGGDGTGTTTPPSGGTGTTTPPSGGDGGGGAVIIMAAGAAAAGVVGYGVYNYVSGRKLQALLPEGVAAPENRAQTALLLWNTAGRPEPAETPAFADVADPDTAKAAQWCMEQGLMKRRLNGKFAPGSSIPAYQVLNAYRKLAG